MTSQNQLIISKCIQRHYDKKGKIYGYTLKDTEGKTASFYSDVLKDYIRNGTLQVTNLTLTSDNRLIEHNGNTSKNKLKSESDKPNHTEKSKYPTDKDLEIMVDKARILGLQVEKLPNRANGTCYLISKSEDNHTILISSNINQLNFNYANLDFTKNIQKLQGKITVLGGSGLNYTSGMFNRCKANSIDLSRFDTSNVRSMKYMFYRCKLDSLNISGLNTSKVTDMECMFCGCKLESLDLSSFDTSNVENMKCMFSSCETKLLDLSSFNTSSVTNMTDMFSSCKAQIIKTSDNKIKKAINKRR